MLDLTTMGEAANPPTVKERRAAGRAVRSSVPRSSHGEWQPPADRQDPVDVLAAQAVERVSEFVPIRHRRMLADPFAFYRGGAAIMANDLAACPTTTLVTQLCGDAHLTNFGLFGSPERALVFDLNDFDETHPGPFEWDLKRLVTSAVLLARTRGWSREAEEELARAAAEAYRNTMAALAELPDLEVWYSRLSDQQMLELVGDDEDMRARLSKGLEKARRNDNSRAIAKFTEVVDGRRRIVHRPPIVTRLELVLGAEDAERAFWAAAHAWEEYLESLPDHVAHLVRGYQPIDIALKIVGVGSVGTRCLIALAQGRDEDDLFFFQIKEAQRSVLEPHVAPVDWGQEGRRVVIGQHLMQAASDIFLGWGRAGDRDYYIRQFRDMKGGVDPTRISQPVAQRYLLLCGAILARAHARAGDRVALAGYLGSGSVLDDALVRFATTYADQVGEDYEAFREATSSGRLPLADADL